MEYGTQELTNPRHLVGLSPNGGLRVATYNLQHVPPTNR
jgi:hypothetical protein